MWIRTRENTLNLINTLTIRTKGEIDNLNDAFYRLKVLYNILLVVVVGKESSEASSLGRKSIIRSYTTLITLANH